MVGRSVVRWQSRRRCCDVQVVIVINAFVVMLKVAQITIIGNIFIIITIVIIITLSEQ